MSASCTIIGVSSGTIQYDFDKPSYEFLYQFWNQHRNCMCYFCKPSNPYYVTRDPATECYPLHSPMVFQPNIHVKDNPKLLISDYPSLIAPDKSDDNVETNAKKKVVLTCSQCQKEFKHKKRYKTHVEVCNGAMPCQMCGKMFNSDRCLQDHVRNVHTNSNLSCVHCLKVFKTKVSLRMHTRRMHTPYERQISCSQCDKTFGCQQSLKRHVTTHDTQTQWNCEACGIYFQSSYNLRRHRLMQHVRKTLRCRDCNGYFETLHEWWSHVDSHPKKKYLCTECPLSFNNNKNRKRHSLVHTTQKSFHCGLCDKSFKLKKSLVYHQMHRHLRVRGYQCHRCGNKFSRKCILTEHLKTHSPKTLSCPVDTCHATFHTKYRVACHVATCHHSYFIQTRRLRAASAQDKNRMIRQSQYYIQNDYMYGFNSCYNYG
ncbi:zinc finger protein 17-like [Bolinopsis microptera]|uniref:zinc finger protein 17-like n=1 Tax=Bolinopsis microptera TaxID=2820187 RepID=UPI003079C674